ncbi:hypothetical protein F4777DRAFT_581010 [Nemania sp. FL0916]|nr:hypothetical protein F4777DRAFT_581010 [Nemania sp. FL0916]
MATTVTIPIGDTVALSSALRDGDVVSFIAESTTLKPDSSPNGDNTSLNLVSGDDDYLVHISIRRGNQTVVLNSRSADGNWGSEETFNFDGSFVDGSSSVVTVTLKGSNFLIAIEGKLRYTYARRIDKTVKGLRYARNGDMTTAIFGDSITAQIIHTQPPPSPGQSFSLPIGNTHSLKSAVATDEFIYFNSSTTSLTADTSSGGDNTSLNLLSGDGDFLLHISIRRANSTIVFNARGVTSGWGTEEQISSKDIFQDGEPTSLVVKNKSSAFGIYINGVLRHTFSKRFSLDARQIRYGRNDGMTTQIFASPIDVAIDKN